MRDAPTHVVDQLRAARALIASGTGWTQNAFGRDEHGDKVDTVAVVRGDGCAWCAYGALMHVTRGDDPPGDSFLIRAVTAPEFRGMEPDEVNDLLGHGAVLRMYDRAIELAWEAIGR